MREKFRFDSEKHATRGKCRLEKNQKEGGNGLVLFVPSFAVDEK